MSKISILVLFFLTITSKAFTCDCDSLGSFLTVAPQTDMVALVKVKSYLTYKDMYGAVIPMSMEVEIIEVYKGTEIRKTVTIWGDNGSQCRPYLSIFKPDQYYVIAFYKAKARRGNTGEQETDYTISICGDFWLSVNYEEQFAWGGVSDKLTEIKLEELKKELATK